MSWSALADFVLHGPNLVGACHEYAYPPMNPDQSLVGLANLYATVNGRLSSHRSSADALSALTETAVQLVPGAQRSGITRGRAGSYETVAPTDDVVVRIDNIQYELASGPCVDAVTHDTVFRTGDLRTDERWPVFGWRAFETAGVLSMMSVAVFLEAQDLLVGLNMYSDLPDAFDERTETVGTVLATYGAVAVAAAAAHERVAHLETALASNREIGVAMGVLMSEHKITRDQAFDLLRIASQHAHRKLSEVAAGVADTGVLELPGDTGARQARPARRGHHNGRDPRPDEGSV